MKKKLVFISTMVLLFGCGQTKNEKKLLSENIVISDSALINSITEKDSLEKLMKFREESLNSEYKDYKIYSLEEIINEDFNGDGVVDKAEFKRLAASGIIITDGRTNKEIRLGFGKQFAHMTDFNWVNFWGVLKDTTTFEITFDNKTGDILGDSIVRLKNKSIFVEEDEVGGGVITYEKDSYKWIHQCD